MTKPQLQRVMQTRRHFTRKFFINESLPQGASPDGRCDNATEPCRWMDRFIHAWTSTNLSIQRAGGWISSELELQALRSQRELPTYHT